MTFGLDTSVVLRLLTGQPQELAARALARYQKGIANGDSFCVSDIVASETYYAIQHHYGKTKEEALSALKGFSSGEGISFSHEFRRVDQHAGHPCGESWVCRLDACFWL